MSEINLTVHIRFGLYIPGPSLTFENIDLKKEKVNRFIHFLPYNGKYVIKTKDDVKITSDTVLDEIVDKEKQSLYIIYWPKVEKILLKIVGPVKTDEPYFFNASNRCCVGLLEKKIFNACSKHVQLKYQGKLLESGYELYHYLLHTGATLTFEEKDKKVDAESDEQDIVVTVKKISGLEFQKKLPKNIPIATLMWCVSTFWNFSQDTFYLIYNGKTVRSFQKLSEFINENGSLDNFWLLNMLGCCPTPTPLYKTFSLKDCAICLGTTGLYVTTKCMHDFHEECLQEWLRTNRTCPICRYPMRYSESYCSLTV